MPDDEFQQWSEECQVCTTFAAKYKQENPEAVIKFGEAAGEEHAWVYDPEEDRTKDATLGQFFEPGHRDNWWPGDEHPMAEEREEFTGVEEFAKGPGGNYLLDELE